MESQDWKSVLEPEDKQLLNLLQAQFPLEEQPFGKLGEALGMAETEVIHRVRRLKEEGIIREISTLFDSRKLGYHSSLIAMSFPAHRIDEAAAIISRHPGVSHNYSRQHHYNLWFTLTIPREQNLEEAVEQLAKETAPDRVLFLPALRVFKLRTHFNLLASPGSARSPSLDSAHPSSSREAEPLTRREISVVRELQQDLPVESHPFRTIAARLQIESVELLEIMKDFLRRGVMRRYGAILRHRRAGFVANALGCWAVPLSEVEKAGRKMASFAAVSHCYQRPTYPEWHYSLFTMIHAHSQQECEEIAQSISAETGIPDYILLYSEKEYKKERVKYFL
jgi:DNA-binding Lrp family transcriptional regulator